MNTAKIPHIRNPLTVIGIFAAVAEVAATIALPQLDTNAQTTFVWFVMGFPLLLVLLFFATLNFNSKALYAPSDFRDEENFMNLIFGSRHLATGSIEISKGLEEIESGIAEIKSSNTDSIAQRVRELRNNAMHQRSEAEQIIKDPYILEFLGLSHDAPISESTRRGKARRASPRE